ncbi:MAG: ABC transporter ATP-binding protein [Betaproteobacteria bacterium]|nr:ABC transporter ATP-binding protein [Betaproteobacteria bacterium]
MSSDSRETPCVVQLAGVGKYYRIYARPRDRLRQLLLGGLSSRRRYYREHWALKNIELSIAPGEVLGVIGRNGAGKSTLLQLVAGTLSANAGKLSVRGRVAALLELGSGFNPDFTGRENVYLNAAILGLSRREIDAAFADIVAFSGLEASIEQPVRTYSSGMTMRLAFSVATHVFPDILIIDEALAVGDGEFARKSFERIMAFKEAGKTILFCSHSLYQVEALCSRAIWLDEGELKADGPPADVTMAYSDFLAARSQPANALPSPQEAQTPAAGAGKARFTGITVAVRPSGDENAPWSERPSLRVTSGKDDIAVHLAFASDPALPPPVVAVCFLGSDGQIISSTSTQLDGLDLDCDAAGRGAARVVFPRFPFLKGNYWVSAFLFCERGIHVYDHVAYAAEISVRQAGLEQGIVALERQWEAEKPGSSAGT